MMEEINRYFSDFSPKQIKQFSALLPLYEEWNQKINVISRKDMDRFYLHHVLHSLSIAAIFEFEPGSKVMDLGTGGGFPGIPLAIYYPDVHFHLVDSIQKKLKVIEDVVERIGVGNVTVQHTRAENIKDKKFDAVVSRAVAPLKDLWHWSRPLLEKRSALKKASGLICLKGGDLSKEMQESNVRPKMWEINQLFEESFFEKKYVLQVV